MKNFIVLVIILLITVFGIYSIDKFVAVKTSNLSDVHKLINGLNF